MGMREKTGGGPFRVRPHPKFVRPVRSKKHMDVDSIPVFVGAPSLKSIERKPEIFRIFSD